MQAFLYRRWCKMRGKYNIVELFSGIGSQAVALKNIGIDIDVQATCEWDIHAFMAYDAIHNGSKVSDDIIAMTLDEVFDELKKYPFSNNGKEPMREKTLYSYGKDILHQMYSALCNTKNLVDINSVSGEQMPDNTDIMTYSFPCQDLSNVGAFHGYNKGIDKGSGNRSSLLWQVGRILREMASKGKSMPRYLVMENVPTLLSNRHKGNFNIWISELNQIGYESSYFLLNAKDFGIPQNRPRLLMISVYVGDNMSKQKRIKDFFAETTSSSIISDYRKSRYYKNHTIRELLRIPESHHSIYWQEAIECTPNDTPSRRKIWSENPKIIDADGHLMKGTFIRTITTKQDRHPNSGNIYFDCGIEGKSKFRYLTPRECLLFMGFKDRDYENIINSSSSFRKRKIFPRDKIIKMAGNSIPVQLLEGVFYQLYKLEKINN